MIPSLSLVIENNKHKIEYECENRYKGILSFDKFIKECSKFIFVNIAYLTYKKIRIENKYEFKLFLLLSTQKLFMQ